MKHITTILIMISLALDLNAQTSGGPDTYGYTWKDSNDPNGPTYSWLNIQDVGVLVQGLTDDNASSFIPMGMDFHYYWYDVNQLVIGSNGWVGFDATSNIAHCFPTIPTPAGVADNYLAPFMTDLIMDAPGTTPQIYYWHDSSNGRFVISYLNIPWWQLATPGYLGSNSFQVILSSIDSSITFQYGNMDQASLLDNATCTSDLIIGMENITGNIGIGLGQYTENVPPDNYAIKFYPPAVALIAIPDATPLWNQNVGNKGFFVQSGTDLTLQSEIKNVGNADIVSDINVSAQLQNLSSLQVYSSTDLIAGLNAGSSTGLTFVPDANLSPGQYYFNTAITNSSDINPGNNSRTTEVNAVDIFQPDVTLSYATQNPPDANVGWTGGGGMGVLMELPSYPADLNSVDAYVVSGINGASEFTMKVLAADGPDGLPGTVLDSVYIAANSYTPDGWVNVPLSSPVTISSGGFYIAFIHGADGVFLGTETAGPISRQTYEFVGGSWAVYRENTVSDVLLNGHFDFSTTVGISENDRMPVLRVMPNPNNGQFTVSADHLTGNADLSLFDSMGRTVRQLSISGTQKTSVDMTDLTKGIYFCRLSDGHHVSVLKFVTY